MNAPGKTAKQVQCPSCGGSITLRALGHSVMASCPNCSAQIDVSRPDIQLIEKYRQQVGRLRLPLGARGLLRGQTWEVVGAMQRVVSGFHWQEFLLFNPYAGFRWLVYDAGHWSFGEMIKNTAEIVVTDVVRYRGQLYRKFQSGTPIVEWVVGEFYWRVHANESVNTSDYIAPPHMLSLEKSGREFTWTLLEYLDPRLIEKTFSIESPTPGMIAPHQPNPAMARWRAIRMMTVAALAVAAMFQLGTIMRALNRPIEMGPYMLGSSAPQQQVFGPFTLPATLSLNELTASADLQDSWVELDCSLVNTATGESLGFTNAFYFYDGRDSDGYWKEGSRQDTSLIKGVPGGVYNLVIEGAGAYQSGIPLDQAIYLNFRHDVVPWQNFGIAVLLILAYPLRLLWRKHTFEKERWSESDFSPYASDDDE